MHVPVLELKPCQLSFDKTKPQPMQPQAFNNHYSDDEEEEPDEPEEVDEPDASFLHGWAESDEEELINEISTVHSAWATPTAEDTNRVAALIPAISPYQLFTRGSRASVGDDEERLQWEGSGSPRSPQLQQYPIATHRRFSTQ